MTVDELMAESGHEVYFCIVTPDEQEHVFLSSDYHGAHPDVMPELEPLLGREIDEFNLEIREDPEKGWIDDADEVPMIVAYLVETEEETERKRVEAMKGCGI